jgi:hypothetical protein
MLHEEDRMPKFIDFHPGHVMKPDSIARLREAAARGTVDQFGVRQLELYYSPDGKGVYCLLEAPDEEAVRQHHGGQCGEIMRVESLL